MNQSFIDIVANLISSWIPSAIGSAGALLWLDGSYKRRICLFILGAFLGVYVGSYISSAYGFPSEMSAFVIGLFGMSIADKLFKTLEQTNLSDIILAFFRRFLK